MGAIIKILLPVNLNEITCTITDTASKTKSPPIIAKTISCLVIIPTAPNDMVAFSGMLPTIIVSVIDKIGSAIPEIKAGIASF